MNNLERINNRVYIMANLESIIKESIYFRTHSDEFESYNRLVLGSSEALELKTKIL